MNKKILLLGAGGHCKSIIDSLVMNQIYTDIGIVDKESRESNILGISRVGIDADLYDLYRQGWTDAFISVGSIGDTSLRRKLYVDILKIGFTIPSIVDRTAVIAADIKLPMGVYIGKRAVINAGTVLGACAIINTGSIIEHDCNIGDFAHISPGAVLCGQVSVGADTHIGAGSVVLQKLSIGDHTVIGIGSVVTKSIPDHVRAYGNPCKVVFSQ